MADEPVKTIEELADTAARNAAKDKSKDKTSRRKVLLIVGIILGLSVVGIVLSVVFPNDNPNNANQNLPSSNGAIDSGLPEGESTKVPEDSANLVAGWPSDVPIFEPSGLRNSSLSDVGKFSLMAATNTLVSEVTAFYRDKMPAAGWKKDYDASAGGASLLIFKKDNRTANISVTANDNPEFGGRTGFAITVE